MLNDLYRNSTLPVTEIEKFQHSNNLVFLMTSTILKLCRSCEFETCNGLQKVLLLFKGVGEFGEFCMENQGLYLCYTMV